MPYDNPSQQAPADDAESSSVESASAGAACQTTTSKFAYILTSIVLCCAMLVGAAISILAFGALASYVNSPEFRHRYYGYTYDFESYEDDPDSLLSPEGERELEDLFNRFLEEGESLS